MRPHHLGGACGPAGPRTAPINIRSSVHIKTSPQDINAMMRTSIFRRWNVEGSFTSCMGPHVHALSICCCLITPGSRHVGCGPDPLCRGWWIFYFGLIEWDRGKSRRKDTADSRNLRINRVDQGIWYFQAIWQYRKSMNLPSFLIYVIKVDRGNRHCPEFGHLRTPGNAFGGSWAL